MAARAPSDTEPITACDPLLANSLRAALECHIRGDYHSALERLKDCRALAPHRLDMLPYRVFEQTLEFAINVGVLVSHELPIGSWEPQS